MFNFLKKKNTISNEDIIFLKNIISALPEKYSYLEEQVNEEFILGKKVNPLGSEGCYTLTLNASLEEHYANTALPRFFIIKDLGLLNIKRSKFEGIELHIMEGMLAGFKVSSAYYDYDYTQIDASGVKEKHFNDDDKTELLELLGEVRDNVMDQFEVNQTFKIEIDEGTFYVLKSFGDGNYLSIRDNGAVYGMIHDPYDVEKLFEDKKLFFDAISEGSFDIMKYYENKFI